MPRTSTFLTIALATLAIPAFAQAPDTTQQPAPIERHFNDAAQIQPDGGNGQPNTYGAQPDAQPQQPPQHPQRPRISVVNPAPGVVVRTDAPDALHTVTADATRTELRLDHGLATVSVHDPKPDSLVLVDLPGGQTQLVKNGLYTFNAETNTVRTFRGEASAFAPDGAPIAVKEDHQLTFAGAQTHATYSDPYSARQDYLPAETGGYHGEPVVGYYAPYPYYAYGYPYWGWGYPYVGFGWGWGWGGGFYGGRGFYGGGFRGRR